MWRRLYNGVQKDGKLVRYSLEEAAKLIDVSKKSLDDYLLQLRFGKKYNFDFIKHKNDKVGVLRAFVKKMKEQEKKNGAANTSKSGKQTSMIENVNRRPKAWYFDFKAFMLEVLVREQ